MERASAWGEAKAKEKVDISKVNAEARERASTGAEARLREKDNDVQRAAAEARRGQVRHPMLQGMWQ